MKKKAYSVAIVGATGLVGKEMLRVLDDQKFPIKDLKLLASKNSAGESIQFKGKDYKVEELKESSFDGAGIDFALFATSSDLSEHYVPLAADSGAVAIDNSSHFRMHPEVPLVVPEVNPSDIEQAKSNRIIANPNCSTIQLVVALKPLHDLAALKRVVVSTYQSVSGAGSAALDELQKQVSDLFSKGEIEDPKAFPHQIAFNCIPHIDVFQDDGFSKEEMKMINETRKILNIPELKITATAVRVPTMVSHSESVNIETGENIEPEAARDALRKAGVIVADEPSKNLYPLGFDITGNDQVFVGRIRKDKSVEHGLHLWVVADNLRKGAATNAVQIAQLCIDRGFVGGDS